MTEQEKLKRKYQVAKRVVMLIDADGYELSHEKIVNQRDWFKKLAKEAREEIYDIIYEDKMDEFEGR